MKNETRREFLHQAGTIGACICCFGAVSFLASCGTSKDVSSVVPSLVETADDVSFLASALEGKSHLIISTKKFTQPIFISKENNKYLALRMHCTHRGCQVNATPEKFVCPCHGSEFSLEGDVLKGPAKDPLISLPVTTDGQNVIVHFS